MNHRKIVENIRKYKGIHYEKKAYTTKKSFRSRSFSGWHFSTFGLNTEIYSVCGPKNSKYGHSLLSVKAIDKFRKTCQVYKETKL